MPTHKKGHDKDKYYHLAKDQGYRSRAAFKLIQINKRYDFLSKSKVLVDLCAAPGGWCQVAAKFMPAGSIILGIDLLPIRPIRNVKTIVSDITTAECRRTITQELQGWKADVFLCDGAPNIGAAYNKDAYVQNELVLAALKSATDHLREGGTFCSKVYRSKDYNALIWVLQQFFEEVQAIKPNSSRSQSSEIFIVCQRYIAPQKIDPKLLDPNHVFKDVADPGLKKIDVLHKNYEKHNKRHRTGYDESLGMTLTSSISLTEFIRTKDAVRVLTDYHRIIFESDDDEKLRTHPSMTTELLTCFNDLRILGKIDFKKMLKWRLSIRKELLLEQPKLNTSSTTTATTSTEGDDSATALVEIKEPVKELTEDDIQQEIAQYHERILQQERKEKKKDRKQAGKDRTRQAMGIHNNAFEVGEDMELFSLKDTNANSEDLEALADVDIEDDLGYGAQDSEGEEDGNRDDGGLIVYPEGTLEAELEEQYKRYLRKRRNKKENPDVDLAALDAKEEVTAEGRTRTAKKARLQRTSDGILEKHREEDEAVDLADDEDDDDEDAAAAYDHVANLVGSDDDSDDEEEEEEGEDEEEVNEEDQEDEGTGVEDEGEGESQERYGDNAKDHKNAARGDGRRDKDKIPGNRGKAKAAEFLRSKAVDRWFAHPIFSQTLLENDGDVDGADGIPDYVDNEDESGEGIGASSAKGSDGSSEMVKATAAKTSVANESDGVSGALSQKAAGRKRKQDGDMSAAAEEILAAMPKTDREKRKEKRLKQQARNERKIQKRNKVLKEDEDDVETKKYKGEFAIAPNPDLEQLDLEQAQQQDDDELLRLQDPKEFKRRQLIREGFGKQQSHTSKQNEQTLNHRNDIEVVPMQTDEDFDDDDDGDDDDDDDEGTYASKKILPPRYDERSYGSDEEVYDKHDRAMTLALGKMMLRKSKQKALVDASYNRFAWNDPKELPDWFLDDEMRHNRPQVPVPSALLSQIKSKYQMTGTREIKKVAEARARKKKRAANKMKVAKKQANLLAENSELSQKQKMKAISRALKSSKLGDKQGKTYVVTKKVGGASSGTTVGAGKGKLKFVDKRLKKDARAIKRNAKKRKH